jgi:hypothetical protein
MQADPSNKWNDQEFEDHAWSQMSMLLDKELPVEKKKRRVVFWWLFAAGIGLLFIGGIVWSLQQQEADVLIVIGEEQVVKLEETVDMLKTDTASDLGEEIGSLGLPVDEEAEQEEVKQTVLATKQPNSRMPKSQGDSLKGMIEANQAITASDPPLESQQTVVEVINSAAIHVSDKEIEQEQSTEITPFSKVNSNVEHESKENQRNQQLLEQLPPNVAYSLLSNDKLSTPEKAQQPPSNSHWIVAINGGAIVPINHPSRLFLGTQLNYQLHSKWRIGIGANYIFGRSSVSENDNLAFSPTEMEDTMGPEFDTMFASTDSSFIGESSATRFFQFPVAVAYQFHPRWQLSSGLAYLLPIQNQSESDLSATNVRTTTVTNIVDSSTSPVSNSWQWQAGVSFQATTRLGLQVQYQQQFDQQEIHPLRQSFQLGIRYKLVSW